MLNTIFMAIVRIIIVTMFNASAGIAIKPRYICHSHNYRLQMYCLQMY